MQGTLVLNNFVGFVKVMEELPPVLAWFFEDKDRVVPRAGGLCAAVLGELLLHEGL